MSKFNESIMCFNQLMQPLGYNLMSIIGGPVFRQRIEYLVGHSSIH
jgi:hypothetical protein